MYLKSQFFILLERYNIIGDDKMKYLTEIFLTQQFVEEQTWSKFLYSVSKLNGLLKKWKIYIYIENNTIRYFIKSSKKLPSIIQDFSEFILKKVDEEENIFDEKSITNRWYIVTTKEKSVLDIYDKSEVKNGKKLKFLEIDILPITKNYYRFRTYIFFENKYGYLIKRRAVFSVPYQLLSIDFSKYNRFFYKKDATKFLDIQKTIHILKDNKKDAFLKVNTFPYLIEDYYLHLNQYDFDKHSIIVGASGTGKSKLISTLVMNLSKNEEYKRKYKVVIIDPHAEIKNDIGGIENTKILDFEKTKNSFNLFMRASKDLIVTTELILSLFQTLMADQYNSKLERVLRHSIYLLTKLNKMDFANLKKLLTEVEYKNELLKADNLLESTIDFFSVEFNKLKTESYQEAFSPIISFIDEMELLPGLKSKGTERDLKDIIEDNFLTIISLNQSKLGMNATKTIAGFTMQQILQLIQNYTYDEHIIFIIDEVALLENPILSRFLSESRKYNLSLILAQQYFNQISEKLQKAIFSNMINYYIFRVSREDARILDGNIRMDIAVKNSFITRMKILTELKNRECIVRIGRQGKVYPAFQAKTLDFVPIPQKVLNQILTTEFDFESEEQKKIKEKEETDNTFSIDSNISLKDIMISQSPARKRREQLGY